MKVERYVELLNGGPENIPFLTVVEDHVVAALASSLGVVDESTFEAVFFDDSLQLCGRLVGVMHGERAGNLESVGELDLAWIFHCLRKGTEPIRMALDCIRNVIIDFHC
jgi:hypothetical protein